MRATAFFLAVLTVVVCLLTATFAQDTAAELNKALSGKVLELRNHYEGSKLEYDADGKVLGSPRRGTWVRSGDVKVGHVAIKNGHLQVQATRLLQFFLADGQLVHVDSGVKVRLNIALPANASTPQLSNLLQHIFTGERAIPPPPSAAPSLDGRYEYCDLEARNPHSNALSDSDGYRIAGTTNCLQRLELNEPITVGKLPSGELVYTVTKPVKPPKVRETTDPHYTEQARLQRIQGTTRFLVVVDSLGRIESMQLVQPLGYGLDEEAVKSLSQWLFFPAVINGNAESVRIAIEVSFALQGS